MGAIGSGGVAGVPGRGELREVWGMLHRQLPRELEMPVNNNPKGRADRLPDVRMSRSGEDVQMCGVRPWPGGPVPGSALRERG